MRSSASPSIPCSCGGEYRVVPGWESQWALLCRQCGEYHYFVGGIYCVNRLESSAPLPIRDIQELLRGEDDRAIYRAILKEVKRRWRKVKKLSGGYSRVS